MAMLNCMMPELDVEMLGRAIQADLLLRDTRKTSASQPSLGKTFYPRSKLAKNI